MAGVNFFHHRSISTLSVPQRTSAYLGIHIAENRDCQRFLKGKGYPRRCSVKKPHHDLILSWHWNRAWAHKKGLLRCRFLVPLGNQTTRVSLSCKLSFSWGVLAECQYNRGGHLCSVAPSLTTRNNGDVQSISSTVLQSSMALRRIGSWLRRLCWWPSQEFSPFLSASDILVHIICRISTWVVEQPNITSFFCGNGSMRMDSWMVGNLCQHPKVHQLNLGANYGILSSTWMLNLTWMILVEILWKTIKYKLH